MEFASRAAPRYRYIVNLLFLDIGVIYQIALAVVAKETLAFAWVVDNILHESLADDETDQRFGYRH